jgi:hypothetical protein
MVAAAFRSLGSSVVDVDDSAPPEILIFDADPWDACRHQQLHAQRKRLPQATIVAASGLYHADLIADLHASGADAVWYKLAPIAELVSLCSTRRVGCAHHY